MVKTVVPYWHMHYPNILILFAGTTHMLVGISIIVVLGELGYSPRQVKQLVSILVVSNTFFK